MRIAAISDTHGRLNWDIPSCDVFIHAGDITGRGSLQETAVFATKLRERMGSPDGPQHAIIVPGNHDECFELFSEPALARFGPRVHVLLNTPLILNGVRFFGSPWTPRSCSGTSWQLNSGSPRYTKTCRRRSTC